VNWPDPHSISAATAAFLASLVEFVEALTVVLAVGATRGWRNALGGATAALLLLVAVLAVLGPTGAVPGAALQLAIGVLTLMFGLRWLRKAILRAAGLLPLHDEAAAYDATSARLGRRAQVGWDGVALAAAFQVVVLEGIEVVFIVAAIGAGGGRTGPAAAGAGAALLLVLLLGVALHRPITAIPENTLKFAVGVLITAFGTFWTGEGIGIAWPGGDWALPGLSALWAVLALVFVRLARNRVIAPPPAPTEKLA
jgi:Ca2+/H+ antiporter, TMEM165/GDT1 family